MPKVRRPNLKLRWLTLAEIVGVAALLFAGLEYLDSHHAHEEADKARQEAAAEKTLKDSFLIKGEVAKKGDELKLVSARDDQVIQTQTLWFPKAVRADKVEADGQSRLQSDWIADGVRKAAGKAAGGHVPVVVETVFVQDGQTRTDEAVYNLAYSLHHRLLLGDEVKLEGLSLARRTVKGDPQAAADKLWGKG
jgi:hypothetical protein